MSNNPSREGREQDLPAIYKNRPLPIFVDESCRFADDLPNWAHAVDGVNLKTDEMRRNHRRIADYSGGRRVQPENHGRLYE